MPVLGGLEATKRIFGEIPADQQPSAILGLTADTVAQTRGKCLNLGMKDVINKPVRSEQLLSIILKYCPQKSTKQQSSS